MWGYIPRARYIRISHIEVIKLCAPIYRCLYLEGVCVSILYTIWQRCGLFVAHNLLQDKGKVISYDVCTRYFVSIQEGYSVV